jgi:hypothetical protein
MNINYKQKYFKYKQKYKNILGGGLCGANISEITKLLEPIKDQITKLLEPIKDQITEMNNKIIIMNDQITKICSPVPLAYSLPSIPDLPSNPVSPPLRNSTSAPPSQPITSIDINKCRTPDYLKDSEKFRNTLLGLQEPNSLYIKDLYKEYIFFNGTINVGEFIKYDIIFNNDKPDIKFTFNDNQNELHEITLSNTVDGIHQECLHDVYYIYDILRTKFTPQKTTK